MNPEGVFFWQWLRTANWGRKTPLSIHEARQAWKAGEDPTQYSAT